MNPIDALVLSARMPVRVALFVLAVLGLPVFVHAGLIPMPERVNLTDARLALRDVQVKNLEGAK